jgi:hypothetical protein
MREGEVEGLIPSSNQRRCVSGEGSRNRFMYLKIKFTGGFITLTPSRNRGFITPDR